MTRLAELLGLKPRAAGRMGEAAAREAALAGSAGMLDATPGILMWDESGRAVWRFLWTGGPVPWMAIVRVDVDATSGAVRVMVPPR